MNTALHQRLVPPKKGWRLESIAPNTTTVIKKPIKLVFDREEDMLYSVKRHPSKITYRTALDKDGNILGIDGLVYYNGGPYLSGTYVVLQRGVFHANGVYNIPNTYVKGIGIATNTFPSDAFRGFGAPQTLYAIETHMEHIAKRFGIDPAEYKSRYFIKQGGETITNGHVVERVVLPEMLEQVLGKSDYRRKAATYAPGSGRGIGISFYNHGGAFTGGDKKITCTQHLGKWVIYKKGKSPQILTQDDFTQKNITKYFKSC